MLPRLGSVAHALGVQSRASRLYIAGLLSATPTRLGQWNLLNFSYNTYSTAVSRIIPLLQLTGSLDCGNHRTIAVTHQALPFVTATDVVLVCVFVR